MRLLSQVLPSGEVTIEIPLGCGCCSTAVALEPHEALRFIALLQANVALAGRVLSLPGRVVVAEGRA